MQTIDGGDLSRSALVEAMVYGGPEVWEAVTSFCEAVMLAKEEAKRLLPTYASAAARVDGRRAMISGHRRRGFASGEQRVARRPIRTEHVSNCRRCVVFHARLKEPSAIAVGAVCRGRGIR